MKKSAKRIGDILLEQGLVTEAQLHDAIYAQKISSGFLGTILVSRGVISSRQLAQALSEQFNIPLVDFKKQYIDMELPRKFSSSIILDHKCFPFREDENSVTVAITNPLNAVAISKVEEQVSPRKVIWVLASEEDLQEILKSYRQSITLNIQKLLKKDKPA